MIPSILILFSALCLAPALSHALDLRDAIMVVPPNPSVQERKVLTTLLEEIEKRTRKRPSVQNSIPGGSPPLIIMGQTEKLRAIARAHLDRLPPPVNRAEGFRVQVIDNAVVVAGNDSRGLLFGVGFLLRHLKMTPAALEVDSQLKIASAPAISLRGHQLGYRPKVNSYDGFTVAMWDQYIRELAVFGTNAIELIPPRSDDADESPHFTLPKMEMMVEMSRIANEYGLDVWIWYPAMDEDYSNPKVVESALAEWEDVFRRLPRIDHVFVPGGDPGHTQPKHLFALLEKATERLHKHHPKAGMWMSPQGFNGAWIEEFYDLMKAEPKWLAGVVYGPQIRPDLPELAARLPKRYPIRRYPDITHSIHCQYPVPDWDVAYAVTEGREGINPRPVQQKNIFRVYKDYSIGFLTYSEGVNDDVNKFIWSGLGWDPEADVVEILRQFSRFFIGWEYTDSFAQGLLALERNWAGPLLANPGVDTTYQIFARMEQQASPQTKLNWRFQQALYRAYYDSYVRDRLIYETALETQALEKLRRANHAGALAAIREAEKILTRSLAEPVSQDKRQRAFELAEALYQSIRAQLSVPRYQALALGRGANLDTIDVPLNNRLWLAERFSAIRIQSDEKERLAALDTIVNWTDPGPGGYYDDLGNSSRQPHLVRGVGFEQDPMFRRSSLLGFALRGTGSIRGIDPSYLSYRISWRDHAEALFDAPLELRYTNLDADAQYRLRVVYAGDNPTVKLRLVAQENIEIHGWLDRPAPIWPLEFDIPREATRNGTFQLSFYGEPGRGGAGRGNQVAEVWLLRK